MPNRDLNNMRTSYEKNYLLETDCNANPFIQFDHWFQDAINQDIFEPNAMQIATVGKNLQPSLRTVLLKSFDKDGFVFYSNYTSKKGHQLDENKNIACLFWFRELERQIRIDGTICKTSIEQNDIYFRTRPRDSQIAAYSSKQSSVVENRKVIDDNFAKIELEFNDKPIPLNENWGGYIVKPALFEFWQGRRSRLHDRIQYTLDTNNVWKIERLAP